MPVFFLAATVCTMYIPTRGGHYRFPYIRPSLPQALALTAADPRAGEGCMSAATILRPPSTRCASAHSALNLTLAAMGTRSLGAQRDVNEMSARWFGFSGKISAHMVALIRPRLGDESGRNLRWAAWAASVGAVSARRSWIFLTFQRWKEAEWSGGRSLSVVFSFLFQFLKKQTTFGRSSK